MGGSRRLAVGLAVVLATSGLAALAVAPPAGAATTTFTVDNLGDGPADPTPCLTPIAGECTLRDAFAAASTLSTDVEIDVPNGAGNTISLTDPSGALSYVPAGGSPSLTVEGHGVTVDQTVTNAQVVLDATAGMFTLDGLTITGGNTQGPPTGPGSAVLSIFGPLTLSNSTVSDNTAAPPSGSAGAIIAAGLFGFPVTFDNVTVIGNQVTASGLGFDFGIVEGSSVSVTDSRFIDNSDQAGLVGEAGGTIDAGPDPSTISDSTFTGNTNTSTGFDAAEGILDIADTTLTGSTLTSNTVTSGDVSPAFGVADTEDLTMSTSLVEGNTVTSGLQAFGTLFPDQLTMTASTVAGNTVSAPGATASGGGVATIDPVTVQNSTITNNTASGATANGGGIDQALNPGDLTVQTHDGHWDLSHAAVGAAQTATGVNLSYATVVDNTAVSGANLQVSSLDSFGSVVALPHGAANCVVSGTVTSEGYNFSDDASCQLTAAGDLQNAGDPDLAALAAAGGPTPTRVPEPASLLLNAIPLATCATAGILVDQRGVTRPQGPGCDIGAVEVVATPVVPRIHGLGRPGDRRPSAASPGAAVQTSSTASRRPVGCSTGAGAAPWRTNPARSATRPDRSFSTNTTASRRCRPRSVRAQPAARRSARVATPAPRAGAATQ